MVKHTGQQSAQRHSRTISDPVTAAYAKVIRKSKKAAALQSAMAPEVLKEMALGMDARNDMFAGSQPSFFLDRVGPTYKAERRKRGKEYADVNLRSVAYDFCQSTVPNEQDRSTGQYHPDLLGMRMHVDGKSKIEQKFFHCRDAASHAGSIDMSDLVHADVSVEHIRNLFSLVCLNKSYLGDAVARYMEEQKELDEKCSVSMARILNELTGMNSPFRHENVSLDVIPSSDYTLHICRTRHHYDAANHTYGWEVQKTIVLASTHGGTDQHIPVCEELVIQLKLQNASDAQGAPLLVNHKTCCILSCSLADDANSCQARMHYFGDNAFSVGFTEVTDQLPANKTKICARLAGTLAKHMQNMNSTDIVKVKTGVDYYKGMFTRPYNIDAEDSGDYAKALSDLIEGSVSGSDTAKAAQLTRLTAEGADDGAAIKRTLGSFLKRQNIRSFIEVDAEKCCSIVKWLSSPSFSVLALSPHGKPHINCVFVLTYSYREIVQQQEPMDTGGGAAIQAGRRSMLTPDLEDELNEL